VEGRETIMARAELHPDIEAPRARLELEPLDDEAARELRAALSRTRFGAQTAGERTLLDACDALDGGRQDAAEEVRSTPPRLGRAFHESVIIHPREKQGRHHQLASVLGRVLQLIDRDEVARTIARVTEKTTPQTFPQLHDLTAGCAKWLEIAAPEIRIARGEERLFTALVDRAPFLCVHHGFFAEGSDRLSKAEALFALGHQLEHIRSGHTAFLQISPERFEGLMLDQVPFLVRTPVELATKAIGWTRANVAVKRVGEWLPQKSRSRKVVSTVGGLLPDKDQETVLPEVVHDWARSWIQGVELSADRAGLVLSGSATASCTALLRLTPELSGEAAEARTRGLRWLLLERADVNRAAAERIRELLTFAVSREYLGFLAPETV
jgi:hypothetical protein